MSFCFLYNVVSENYSVQNSPWGGGEGGLLPAQGLYMEHYPDPLLIWSTGKYSNLNRYAKYLPYSELYKNTCKLPVLDSAHFIVIF